MPFIRLSDNFYPLYEGDIRLTNPDMGVDFVLPDGYAEITPSLPPSYDPTTQTCFRQAPAFIDGVWVEIWAVRDLTEQEISAKTANAKRNKTAVYNETIP